VLVAPGVMVVVMVALPEVRVRGDDVEAAHLVVGQHRR
jgi:hypothetical protein